MFSYGSPHMAELKQGDQLEPTYSSSVRIRDIALKTCQKRWTIGRSGERGLGISVLVAWWWWWWWWRWMRSEFRLMAFKQHKKWVGEWVQNPCKWLSICTKMAEEVNKSRIYVNCGSSTKMGVGEWVQNSCKWLSICTKMAEEVNKSRIYVNCGSSTKMGVGEWDQNSCKWHFNMHENGGGGK